MRLSQCLLLGLVLEGCDGASAQRVPPDGGAGEDVTQADAPAALAEGGMDSEGVRDGARVPDSAVAQEGGADAKTGPGAGAWALVPAVSSPVSIAISPHDGMTPFVLYVGSAGKGIFRSADGTTWTSAGPPSVVAVASMPMAIASFASLADGSVQLTMNGGTSWSPCAASPGGSVDGWLGVVGVGPLGTSSSSPGGAVVFDGKAAGAMWSASTVFGGGTATALAFGGGTSLAVLNGAPKTVYAATSSGLYATTTGGE